MPNTSAKINVCNYTLKRTHTSVWNTFVVKHVLDFNMWQE